MFLGTSEQVLFKWLNLLSMIVKHGKHIKEGLKIPEIPLVYGLIK